MSSNAELWDVPSGRDAFWRGVRHVPRSLMCYVLFGTFIGIGALAHDSGLSLVWLIVSTIVIWAGPAQVILMATLASGASLAQSAIAVALSGIRLLPMVVALLPQLRSENTKRIDLVLPAHFTAVTFWVESQRMIQFVPRAHRIAFCNGFGLALMALTTLGGAVGFLLADSLPPLLAVAILFLTPVVFLLSMTQAARQMQDWLALALGLVATPLVSLLDTGVDLLIGSVIAGTLAYALGRAVTRRGAQEGVTRKGFWR